MSTLLEWLDNASTEELENEYLYAPEGLRRDGIAIELERRKLRQMAFHVIEIPDTDAEWLERQSLTPPTV